MLADYMVTSACQRDGTSDHLEKHWFVLVHLRAHYRAADVIYGARSSVILTLTPVKPA